ncbi:hypothetical protein HJC23_003099 [Cyclotella cryptica]|uniref:Uncharacterized protein n=1 Tax=Cyclotella cryptica TaxID=29204 RepID=A0ABD3P5T0_9STRA|eukprot:CCRYP_017662-RA/>CCRYP_017662-RA protein AED:0.08 eAED:0.08 QI:361/1/1/1/0.85/0.75/8/2678/982
MGLFKTKGNIQHKNFEATDGSPKREKKRFIIFKGKKSKTVRINSFSKLEDPAASPSHQTSKTFTSQSASPERTQDNPCPIDVDGFPVHDEVDLPAGIPKSISAWAPSGVLSDLGLEEQRCDFDAVECNSRDNDVDSLGSPCEQFRKNFQAVQASSDPNGKMLMESPDGTNENREPPGIDIHSPPSTEYLSYYINALSSESSPDPSSEAPSRALRSLFSLSEHASSHQDRVKMVQWQPPSDNSMPLINALLDFLNRCERDTSEQYLAMLVLNNVSIPHENKRRIAIDCGGVKALARLLCQDPGCHLLVIILVNLTFCEASVRRDLLTYTETPEKDGDETGELTERGCRGDSHVVEALAYALLLASLSSEELASLPPIPLETPEGVVHTPLKLLSILTSILEDMNLHPSSRYKADGNSPPMLFEGGLAETARWSLCALKNLTRPDKLSPSSVVKAVSKEEASVDRVAAYALLDAGIVPLILRVVRIEAADGNGPFLQDPLEVGGGDGVSASNFPCWHLNSPQDAALYVLLHLTSVPEVRGILRNECGCTHELTKIVECGKSNEKLASLATGSLDRDAAEVTDLAHLGLQSMKARIALSYLSCTEGHYDCGLQAPECDTTMILAEHEVHCLIELLANCLHSRPKEGPGGYSSSSFSLKGTMHSIRCLMTKRSNRIVFASTLGARLNALLLKALAQYSFNEQDMDGEAAEHAVFSLYLMSNHGFQESISYTCPEQYQFLPAQFGAESHNADASTTLIKVLTIYSNMTTATPAGRHAALQLLLRARFLRYSGTVSDLVDSRKQYPCMCDFDIDEERLAATKTTSVEQRMEGVPPAANTLLRAIIRYQTNASSICVDPTKFPNALAAVKELSFGSKTVKHSGTIDEIAIANNIAKCADGLIAKAYGYAWRWEDEEAVLKAHPLIDENIQSSLNYVSEKERSVPYSPRRKGIFGRLRFSGEDEEDEPFSVLGLRCGVPMCGRYYARREF